MPLASTELAAPVLSFPRLLGKMHPYGQGVGKMYRPDESKWGANDEDKGDGKQSSRVWPSRLKESRAAARSRFTTAYAGTEVWKRFQHFCEAVYREEIHDFD